MHVHFFLKVDEAKPVTNQRSSGRCWLFACLNAMRIPFMKENNLDDFEFSQGYLFFWDKVVLVQPGEDFKCHCCASY